MKPISLEELDERASLQRRVDQKYLFPRTTFAALLSKLDGVSPDWARPLFSVYANE